MPKNVKEFLLNINSYLPDPSCGAGRRGQKVDSLELNLSHSSPSGCQDGLFANDNILTVVEIISLRGMDSRETMWGEISRGEIFDGRCN